MNNDYIKIRLKEALDELFDIDEAKRGKTPSDKDKDEKLKGLKKGPNKERGRKDYSDVRRAFEKLGGPSMVDVMKLTGTPDDEKGVNRSLFRKKVKQIKNKDTGSYYQFDNVELNKVRAALDIKS
jgi:hypothetical protein